VDIGLDLPQSQRAPAGHGRRCCGTQTISVSSGLDQTAVTAQVFPAIGIRQSAAQSAERLRRDLARRVLDERKVLAICVDLLQKTFLRVGTKTYLKQYKSVGLSTLKDKHVKINGNTMQLSFVGKKGVRQDVKITDRRLARLVKKCREIPGQELFQYFDENGQRRSVDSGKINDYIK